MEVNQSLLADEFTFRNGKIYALPIQYLLAKLTSISSHSEKTVYLLEPPFEPPRVGVRYAEFSGRSTCEIAKPQHSVL